MSDQEPIMEEAPEPGDLPPEIPQIFRLGPGMLILGSICFVPTLMIFTQALRWGDFLTGIKVEAFMMVFIGIPLAIFLIVVQGILALLFMSKKRRSWWRSGLVLLPSILIIIALLATTVSLFPAERRARNSLTGFMDGSLPESVEDISLSFTGGIDPGWSFEFLIDPDDFKSLSELRDYEGSDPHSLQVVESGTFYNLAYDPATRRATFSVMTT